MGARHPMDVGFAKVAKLVDAQDSGSCSRIGCKGSSPFFRIESREGFGSSGFFRAFLMCESTGNCGSGRVAVRAATFECIGRSASAQRFHLERQIQIFVAAAGHGGWLWTWDRDMLNIDGIKQLIEPAIGALGLVLYDAELRRDGRQLTLRVVVDRAQKKSATDGVTVDELAKASDDLSALLDLEDPIAEPYRLTLESPGIERDLTTLRHFVYAVGERVRVVTRGENAEVVEGVLENVGEDNGIISIHVDSGIKQIDVATIKSARTVYLWESQTGTKRKF